MDRLKFWVVAAVIIMVEIYIFKGLAAQVNIPSVQKFAQAI